MKTALLLCLLCLNSTARTVYLKAVDEDGEPLDGVTFTLDWYYGMNPWRPKCGRGTFVSGRDGSAKALITRGSMIILVSAQKDGYVYENYLNYSGDPRRHYLDQPGCATKQQPWTAVLRKRMPSSFLLTNNNMVKDIFNAISSSFASNGDGTVYSVNIFGRLGKKAGEKYDDFFVRPVYDAESNRWSATFWTTNAHCGLVASTRRVYAAPERGYAPKITVTQEEYTNRSFTIYLKTRKPMLYAMIGQPIGTERIKLKPFPKPYFKFVLSDLRINPYGRRELEYENAVCRTKNYSFDFESQLKNDALNYILVLKQRAKIPDMPACQKLAGRICDVLYEKSKYQDHNVMVDNQIRELQKEPVKNGKKISKLASTMYSIDLIRELNREFNDLKQQLDAAKLPNDIPDIIPELPKDGGDAKPRSN